VNTDPMLVYLSIDGGSVYHYVGTALTPITPVNPFQIEIDEGLRGATAHVKLTANTQSPESVGACAITIPSSGPLLITSENPP
jgi:hypothetical protein